MAGRVAIVGGRSVSPAGADQVAQVAISLVKHGHFLVTGCAAGADCAAVAAALTGRVPVSSLQVLAAFGPDGQGACGVSAVSEVQAFAAHGGAVSWWSGGGSHMPLRARLAERAVQVVGQASSGLVAVQPGRGSWRACRLAVARGLPVVAFSTALETLGAGEWELCQGNGIWANAWRWVPASLF
ncbi:DNA-processing protein DprA [Halomonas sp. SpR1]|uniref:DNA-processing protein DprA n=1 Tax=Halomonas sp. SpR1 TaxID=3050462 RepID=UPI0027E56679|nr:DNA-processing protein DprA [Halomonas sp. SpR1]MDQ7733795.1 DNA-processing protein DprA [Halomonas sp. SpR1]